MTGLVVIGASYAGVQAALVARESGFTAPITIVADETCLPYQRPPLSKDFLLGSASESHLTLRDSAFFKMKRIDLILGERITAIDRRQRTVELAGSRLAFDTLFIGTGSRARTIALPGAKLSGVRYLRTMRDAMDLRHALTEANHVVVVGGGFIGLEVAATSSKLGKNVTLLESAARLLERVTSPIVSEFLADVHRQRGVDVRLRQSLKAIEGEAGRATAVICQDGTRLPADIILIGIGGIPNDELARAAGLACNDGIEVDDHERTSDPSIYAAGDCASHFNPFLQDWTRLESVQNAQDQAKAAGLALAGKFGPYQSVPRFWSDQFELKWQTVGLSRGYDEQVVRGSMNDGKFSVFYYRKGKLIAADSINRPGDQMAARKLIGAGHSPLPSELGDMSFDLNGAARNA